MDGGGALSLLDDNMKMGPATTMDLQPVYSDMFLSAATNPDGVLVVKSWRLDGSSLVELDKYEDSTRFYAEVAAGAPLTSDLSGHEAITVALTPGVMVHDVWAVDETTGAISLMGELLQGGLRDGVGITPFLVNTVFDGELFPPAYYATTFRSGGMQVIRYYRVGLDGTPIQEGLIAGGFVEEVAAARLGIGGLMVASREADGTVQLDAWEARRNDDNSISPDVVSQHTAPAAGSLDLARVPSTHADGDYVTAVTDPLSGELRLRAYRSGDRPF
jgi:hypothetical protein